MMAEDPYKYFRIEARELVDLLGKGMLELERAAGPETLGRILRHAHTLKGAARVVRQPGIADRAHAIEDLMAPLRDANLSPDPDRITRALALIDGIAKELAAIRQPTAQIDARVEDAPMVVRAELGEMDALIDGIVETTACITSLRATADLVGRIRQLADLVGEPMIDGPRRSGPDGFAEELRRTTQQCQRELDAKLDQATREVTQIREAAERLRLLPVSSLFTTLERAARDTAREIGVQVVFETHGGEVRFDAHVLGTMQGALVQLVRNAVAHGIEPEQERLRSRKPGSGRIRIDVVRRGKRAVFTCRDDGRGLDTETIRRAAAHRGVTLPEVADAAALLAVLMRGGISTTTHVTEVAGRGIGLDVVRAAVERLGGELRVESERRTGTTFEISVPLSLSSIEVLDVDAAGMRAALPLDAVRTCRRVRAADVSRTPHGESVLHGDAMIPLLPLATVLGGARIAVNRRGAFPVVVLEGGRRTAAIAVDRVLGTVPVIVRQIPDVAAVERTIAGAALDTLGTPQLVLDPEELVAAAHRERTIERELEARVVSVLVVDDSLTTRMLERSILESAGYDVDTAVSGEDGLDSARRKRYALFLVDVEMPGIDGFTFVERVRADDALRDTPAILVTSRSGAADRLRGEQVGAQGYIVKSEFDQLELLARIKELVRHA